MPLAVLLLTIGMFVSAQDVIKMGDANGDGVVNVADIVEVVNYITGRQSERFNPMAADVNGDGHVDEKDLPGIVDPILENKPVPDYVLTYLLKQEKTGAYEGLYYQSAAPTSMFYFISCLASDEMLGGGGINDKSFHELDLLDCDVTDAWDNYKEYIEIRRAEAHNLAGVNVDIPRNKFVVVTGLSGSGKSSLAFDTIYAEGQRRYMDTLSTYAKHFMGILEKPEVESIDGLSPIIAIEQKTTGNNPRSTVGTITEIYDFLRLLYARASRAYSPVTGKEMIRYTDEQIVNLIMDEYKGKKCYLLAPLVRGRKGHYRELFDQYRRRGYTEAQALRR